VTFYILSKQKNISNKYMAKSMTNFLDDKGIETILILTTFLLALGVILVINKRNKKN
jgi:hypothetical protein